MEHDLFDDPPVPGLASMDELIDQSEERALISFIDGADLAPFRFQGWTGNRLTASFGWSYEFDGRGMVAGPPIPSALLGLRDRMAAFADLEPQSLEQALLIRYDPGEGIGWHRDRPHYDGVVGLSLGAAARLRLRRRRPGGGFDRAVAPLPRRGAYHLSGEVRHDWEHSIVPGAQRRWSVTFRSLVKPGNGTGRRTS